MKCLITSFEQVERDWAFRPGEDLCFIKITGAQFELNFAVKKYGRDQISIVVESVYLA